MQNEFLLGKRWLGLLAGLLVVSSATVQAHPFHTEFGGFAGGWVHPWLGLDHLVAMAAVGFWAAQLSGRARWLVPGSFVAMMSGGVVVGLGSAAAPFVEQAVLASLLVLGLLIATSKRLPLAPGMVLVGFFACFHGLAHGGEVAAQTFRLWYVTGLVLATAALHLLGYALGISAQRQASRLWVRCAGVGVLAAGLLLFLR